MTTAETLRALLALVEEAKAGSRELDAELWWAFDGEPLRGVASFREDASALGVVAALDERFHVGWRRINLVPPPLTTSIDAALALVAKVLPGATWAIHPGWGDDIPEGEARGYEASVGGSPDCGGPWTKHDTPPLAIITSLLAALLHQSETAHVER